MILRKTINPVVTPIAKPANGVFLTMGGMVAGISQKVFRVKSKSMNVTFRVF